MHLHYFSKPSAGTRRYVRYYTQREAQLGTSINTLGVPARSAQLLDFEFGSPLETRRMVRKLDLLELTLVDRHRIELAIMTERHVESARSVPRRPHRPGGLDESSSVPGDRLFA